MNSRQHSGKVFNDEERTIEAAKKDVRYFKPIYEKYFTELLNYAYRKLGDEELAADIVSQVFVKAMAALPRYEQRGLPFSAWLYRIATNEINQYYRRSKKMRTVVIEDFMLNHLAEEVEEPHLEELKRKLKVVLQNLSVKELYLIELRFHEGKSFKEIGYILDITENNAKVRMHRLISKLRTQMVPNRTVNEKV